MQKLQERHAQGSKNGSVPDDIERFVRVSSMMNPSSWIGQGISDGMHLDVKIPPKRALISLLFKDPVGTNSKC